MSLFDTVTLPCPSCGTKAEFEVVHSVNLDRRPDLREAILDGSFQRTECASCGTSFRLDPQFTCLDVGRGQWIAAYPLDDLGEWQRVEAEVEDVFDVAFGAQASPEARSLGADLVPRLVFGWPALWEKLAARDHGLDDLQLELLKIGLLRGMPENPVGPDTELRFQEVPPDGPDELALAWVDSRTGDFLRGLRVPRALYDDVAAEPEGWEDLREQLEGGLFVDANRLLTVGA